jgi:O-antigen/teichoic acid export membrane protein
MSWDARRVLARNTIWNYAGFAINLIANLVMLPYVVGHIGDAAAGVWLLMSSVTGYMGLLELGIVPSLTQSIAASRAREEREAVSRATSSALMLLIGLAALALLLLPAAPSLVGLLRVPTELEGELALAFRITVVGFALRMPLAAFQGVLLGCQRQDRANQLWIGMTAVKLGAAVAVLSAGYGLIGLVVSEMVIHLLAGGFQIRWVFSEVPDLRVSWRLVDWVDVRALMTFGGAIFGVTICSLVIDQTDRLVIAMALPIAMVTYYAAASKIFMLASALTTTMVGAVSPVAADLEGRGDRDGLRSLFLRSTKYTAAIAWPLMMTLGMAGGFLLKIWMGSEFVAALPVVQVLFVGFLVTAHNHAGYSALIGMRRVGATLPRYFIPQAVLNIALKVWLVQQFANVGVALGTAIPALALEYFYLRFVLNELQVSWWDFFERAVFPAAIPALICYIPLTLAYLRLEDSSPVLLLVACLCSALYAAVLWRFLDPDERATVRGYAAMYLPFSRIAAQDPARGVQEPRS